MKVLLCFGFSTVRVDGSYAVHAAVNYDKVFPSASRVFPPLPLSLSLTK